KRCLDDADRNRVLCKHDLELCPVARLDDENGIFNAFDRATHPNWRCLLRPRQWSCKHCSKPNPPKQSPYCHVEHCFPPEHSLCAGGTKSSALIHLTAYGWAGRPLLLFHESPHGRLAGIRSVNDAFIVDCESFRSTDGRIHLGNEGHDLPVFDAA